LRQEASGTSHRLALAFGDAKAVEAANAVVRIPLEKRRRFCQLQCDGGLVGGLRALPGVLGNSTVGVPQDGEVDQISRQGVAVRPSIRIGEQLGREAIAKIDAVDRRPIRPYGFGELEACFAHQFDFDSPLPDQDRKADPVLVGADLPRQRNVAARMALKERRVPSLSYGEAQLGVAVRRRAQEIDVS
jgi:hypothetical protein